MDNYYNDLASACSSLEDSSKDAVTEIEYMLDEYKNKCETITELEDVISELKSKVESLESDIESLRCEGQL